MDSGIIPIFLIDSAVVSVKIQLVQPEGDRKIFGLPLFFIRVLVFHSQPLHYAAASGIIYIMCGCDVWNTILFQLRYKGPACFSSNSLMPEFFAESISEIMAVIHVYIYIPHRNIIMLHTNSIIISMWFQIGFQISFFKKDLCLFQSLYWKPGQISVDFFICENEKESV